MKKKLGIGLLSLTFIIIIIMVIGFINRNKKYTIDDIEQIAEYKYDKTIKCEAFNEDIKYFSYNGSTSWLVTDNNDIYIYNLYNLFSNNTNCKKVNDKFPEVKNSWRNLNGNISYFDEKYKSISINIENNNAIINTLRYNLYFDESPKLEFEKLVEYGYTKVQHEPPTLGIKGDNNIYGFYLGKDMEQYRLYNKYEILINYETIEFSVAEDEVIIDFYYTPNIYYNDLGNLENYKNYNTEENMLNNFILTDKSYYRYQLLNESCKEYIDEKCEYKLMKDEELSKYKDYILYRDSSILITKNGRVFSNYGYGI